MSSFTESINLHSLLSSKYPTLDSSALDDEAITSYLSSLCSGETAVNEEDFEGVVEGIVEGLDEFEGRGEVIELIRKTLTTVEVIDDSNDSTSTPSTASTPYTNDDSSVAQQLHEILSTPLPFATYLTQKITKPTPTELITHILDSPSLVEKLRVKYDYEVKEREEKENSERELEINRNRKSSDIDDATKKQILSRFDEELYSLAPRDTKGSKKKALKDSRRASKKSSKSDSNLKYRDGQIVKVAKGQKFIVEDLKEEWDGGSRGKVVSKGKRGVGFSV